MTAFGAGGGLTMTATHYHKEHSRLITSLMDTLALGFSMCAVWIWSRGIAVLVSEPFSLALAHRSNVQLRSPCAWIFMFAKIQMHGTFRHVGVGISIIAAVGSFSSLSLTCFGLWTNWNTRKAWLLAARSNTTGSQKLSVRLVTLGTQVLTLVFLVLAVELTVRWNQIEEVNRIMQTGQLIPLIVGCSVFVQVLWICVLKTNHTQSSSSSISLED
jgi:hypothetical protein